MLATIIRTREPWEAHLLRGRLESAGIPAFVAFEHHVGVAWYLSQALGGAAVQVPGDCRDEAGEVLALARAGEFKTLLVEEFGDLDDPRCPYCGCTEYERRRPYPRAAAAVLISGLVCLLPPLGWLYGCKACGAAYRRDFCPGAFARSLGMTLFVCAHVAAIVTIIGALFAFLGSRGVLIFVVVAIIGVARWATNRFLSEEPETDS